MPQDREKTSFRSDTCRTAVEKNERLAELLEGYWSDLAIIRIERVGKEKKGWKATYRK